MRCIFECEFDDFYSFLRKSRIFKKREWFHWTKTRKSMLHWVNDQPLAYFPHQSLPKLIMDLCPLCKLLWLVFGLLCAPFYFYKQPSKNFESKDWSAKDWTGSKFEYYQKIYNFWVIIMKLGQKDHLIGLSFWPSFMMIAQKL